VVVLGAGFGGLELTSRLAEALGDDVEVTLIDKSDVFVFGFAKLDVMYGKKPIDEVRYAYGDIAKPGVRFRQETIVSIDPVERRTVTDAGTYEADVLVVALGADLDTAATPGLDEGGNEFYSVEGAERLRDVLPSFSSGHAIVGVAGPSFKCPPAPSEAAILLDGYLRARGVRVHLDDRSDTLNYRIRDGEMMKVPYMAVVGQRERSRSDRANPRLASHAIVC